jgi:hypothetical protein
MTDKMDDVTIRGEPAPTSSGLIQGLTIAASALTAASIAVNLTLQITHFLKKRPVLPDQRTKGDAAALALSVLRQAPGLVKQVRLLGDQVKKAS